MEPTPVTLSCRAAIHPDCKKNWMVSPHSEELTDSTLRGHTIVCNACYLVIEPFMKMNAEDIAFAADQAISHYVTQLRFLMKHPDPTMLADEVRTALRGTMEGSPRHRSGQALLAMVEAELKRREGDLNEPQVS